MRKLILPALAIALMAAAPGAFAAETANGAIKTIDAKGHMLTLDNGDQFVLDKKVSTKNLKTGQKVAVTYNMKDGKMMATKVQPMKK